MKKKIFFPIIFASAICPLLTISSCQKNNDIEIEGIKSYTAHLERQESGNYHSCMEVIFVENIKEAKVFEELRSHHFIPEISGNKIKNEWGEVKANHSESGWIRVVTISDSIYKYNYSISYIDAVLDKFIITPI